MLELDHETVGRLRAKYDEAVRDQKTEFLFEGHRLLTAYAKYLLEFAEQELNRAD